MTTLRYLAAAAPFLLVSAGHAETYPDCEKYDAPLAYNQCLASHGPSAAHALAARTEEGDGPVVRAPQPAAAPVVRSYRPARVFHVFRPVHRTYGRRMTAAFTVQDARPAYQPDHFRRGR